MKKLILLFTVLVANMIATAEAEQMYYVQSVKAKILAAPSFRSAVVTEAGMGQALVLKSKEGSWIKVAVGGKEGYVPLLLVAAHPPLRKGGYIKVDDAEIKQGVRRRSSSFTSAAAARGLTKEDRRRADTEDRVDYPALKQMEALSFNDEEIRQFMEGVKP